MYTKEEKVIANVTAATASVGHNGVGFADIYNVYFFSILSMYTNKCRATQK